MSLAEKNYILTADAAMKKMRRMAFEILENNTDTDHIVFAGIEQNGTVVARNIALIVQEISGKKTDIINIRMDKKHPSEVILEGNADLAGKSVILVDDVANSGKTLTYALKPFLGQYPAKIQALVLVERSYKKFPVRPDYVGLSLSTFLHEHIFVEVSGQQILGAYVA